MRAAIAALAACRARVAQLIKSDDSIEVYAMITIVIADEREQEDEPAYVTVAEMQHMAPPLIAAEWPRRRALLAYVIMMIANIILRLPASRVLLPLRCRRRLRLLLPPCCRKIIALMAERELMFGTMPVDATLVPFMPPLQLRPLLRDSQRH